MKEYIFVQYLINIAQCLGLNDDLIFEKTKERHVVEARRLLWLLYSEHMFK